jgi:RNA polymerase sigma-70 factor (ECF subfamily)
MAEPANSISQIEAHLAALHEASFGWARSCCAGDPDDAADVLQSAYVKVLSGAARFEGRSAFKTWLFGVIRLTALERRRAGAREVSLAEFEVEETEPSTPADLALIEREEGAALRQALAQLPQRQQDVMHLVFYQGMSIAEAAVVMEVSIGSARTHYERGKKRLRTILSPVMREDARRVLHPEHEDDAGPGTGAVT